MQNNLSLCTQGCMNLHLMAGCSDKPGNERMQQSTNDKFFECIGFAQPAAHTDADEQQSRRLVTNIGTDFHNRTSVM